LPNGIDMPESFEELKGVRGKENVAPIFELALNYGAAVPVVVVGWDWVGPILFF